MMFLKRILLLILIASVIFMLGCGLLQRKMLYYPSHNQGNNGLADWWHDGKLIGYAREVQAPLAVWMMLHGNGGQATDRVYTLPAFSERDAVFFLEYPGYGSRPGSPSMESINAAAREGYEMLRAKYPAVPVCVVGESLGSGPASFLATIPNPPARIVLITPFDVLSNVAGYHFPYLPVRLILMDNWNNIDALKEYQGPVDIYAAKADTVIPIRFARALAASKLAAGFHEIRGGHNDWSTGGEVRLSK
jgi:uncharacterized protein